MIPSQFGFLPQNMFFPPLANCHQSLKSLNTIPPPPPSLVDSTTTNSLNETLIPDFKLREDLHHHHHNLVSDLGPPHLLSLQRSTANLWYNQHHYVIYFILQFFFFNHSEKKKKNKKIFVSSTKMKSVFNYLHAEYYHMDMLCHTFSLYMYLIISC